jgi:hypothetical protein
MVEAVLLACIFISWEPFLPAAVKNWLVDREN